MKRPNILILYTDQQRWDAVGCNGNPEIQTPHLDRLAAEGLTYDRFFVQNPVCMPSRVSMLSGQYPSQLRITHMGVPVPEDLPTLPHYLHNYGYRTANIGKLHFLPHACRDHREIHPAYGFDHLEISDEPGCYEDAYRAWVARKAPEELDHISCGLPPATEVWQKQMGFRDGIVHPELREPRTSAFPSRSDLTHSAFVGEQTCEFLRHQSGPFLCIAGFYSPHSPWIAPQEYLDRYDPATLSLPRYPEHLEAQRAQRGEQFTDDFLRRAKQGYYAMITEVDHYVGQILATLDQQGLAEDTIVIFTSDHGEYLGDHLRYAKGFPGEDCVSRVPCLVRWPAGLGRPGRTVRHLTEAVDVVPTLLQWAGIPTPEVLQGRPLPTEDDCPASRESVLLEFSAGKNLRTERYRYVLRLNGKEELYDLERDLGEDFDVAGDDSYSAALSEMRGELARRMLQMERPLTRLWPY
jgi:arylsulfatase A-like enzyme